MPDPGLTAGPCLLKDTMQLSAFSNNRFPLGHDAMLINEGMPLFLCEMAKREMDLSEATAGILGMAFKAESDDKRDSLSDRLKKVLLVECRTVLCSDPYVKDESVVEQTEVLERADIIFIAAPHRRYRELTIPDRIRVVDIWNCLKPSRNISSSAHPPTI
jgi:UDP-N-acetyl-D-mannosaminuronic acid dehydrogenase